MKRRWMVGFLAVALVGSLFCGCRPKYVEGEAKHDFRNADWGMNQARVAKSEEYEYSYASDEIILYQIEEDGEAKDIAYYFVEDKLVEAVCSYPRDRGDQLSKTMGEITESYMKMRAFLTEQYGPPLEEDYRHWLTSDPEHRLDPDVYNMFYGKMVFLQEWDTERTEIILRFGYKDATLEYIYSAKQKQQ